MSEPANGDSATAMRSNPRNPAPWGAPVGGKLFRKYLLLIGGLVSFSLLVGGGLGFYLFSREHSAQLTAAQQEKALFAAARIESFVQSIEQQLATTAPPAPGGSRPPLEDRKLEYLKLLRRVPAITELTWLDARGKERLRLSRLDMDQADTGRDYSGSPAFVTASGGATFHGDLYFRKDSEPYVSIARAAGDRRDGVLLAEVNLKFVSETMTRIKVGSTGYAYVVDRQGTLVAHPDISKVLQKRSLAGLPQVHAALAGTLAVDRMLPGNSLEGRQVLAAFAPVPELGWRVFVELEQAEAFQPLYAFIVRGVLLLLLGMVMSVIAAMVMARRMVRPIKALQASARAIGAGRLDQRAVVHTGDEIEELAAQFNTMAAQLQDSYATLEDRVAARTQDLQDKNLALNEAMDSLGRAQQQLVTLVEQLMEERKRAESASQAKSRFLAAASHDLRQPMHALNLYLATLVTHDLPAPQRRLLGNVRDCARSLDDLFDGLLDISRLDADAVEPAIEVFDVALLLDRICVQFSPEALEKGLELAFKRRAEILVQSDPALCERLLRNLVSNAVRYTDAGRVAVTCRRLGGQVCVTVHDTGRGIARTQHELVFEEFYQVGNASRDRGKGLGLGLSIVRRLALILGCPVRLRSVPGRGSSFRVCLPAAAAALMQPADRDVAAPVATLQGLRVLVIDDEQAILDATRVLLEHWGCIVVAVASADAAIAALAAVTTDTGAAMVPDLLLCDYRLAHGSGVEVIERIRDEFNDAIPAVLVTGDVIPESVRRRLDESLPVLYKPVTEAKLLSAMMEALAGGRPPQPAAAALAETR
jgi:signal transduction histidine kinase/FixJ family two-component response regulator